MVGASRSKSKSKSQSVEVIEPTSMEVDGEQQEANGNGLNDAQEEGEEEQDDDLPAGDDKGVEAGEDDDEEEEEEGEFEVEAIVDHRAGDAAGKYEYLVSWKGYGPDHNTWEPEAHLSHAEDLVSTYWRERPKKSIKADPPSNKRARPSTSRAPPPPKSARTANGRAKRKSPVEADDDVIEDTHPDDLAKYIDVENWEDLVASVDTVERGPDDTLIVYMTMTGGEKGGMPTEVAYKRCPQKILSFYESHLKWRKV